MNTGIGITIGPLDAQKLAAISRRIAQDYAAGIAELRQALSAAPYNADGWRMLGCALREAGDVAGAEAAELAAIDATIHDPEMQAIAAALLAQDLPTAETGLRARLRANPLDVAAIRMMAELAGRIGRYKDAENLLHRALDLAPAFGAARANLATVLYKQHRYEEAIALLDQMMVEDAQNASHRNLKAVALGHIGGYEEALALYEELTQKFPDNAKLWMSNGHILKTVGRTQDSIAAYRKGLSIQPGLGEIWWSLANLKTLKFSDADVAQMQAALDQTDGLSTEDIFHLHFALGKAYDDHKDATNAFDHYEQANRLRAQQLSYNISKIDAQIDMITEHFTPAFIEDRAGRGAAANDPIFILGMPRAGSTLIEQILSSHSAVEGTMELPDIPVIARREGRAFPDAPSPWFAALMGLSAEKRVELGEEFLEKTRIHRKTDKSFYIDKLPNNWLYVPLILLILPNAKIIDARRHPMDCCFSNFRQHFAKGQEFSYDLATMGRYYAQYVRLMRHIDAVAPNRICRVIHEDLVDMPEAGIRNLLDYLGLPFEEDCLNFHTNSRAVRTASSEQVRRPINRDGMNQWKAYDAHLQPLRDALGSLIDDYRK